MEARKPNEAVDVGSVAEKSKHLLKYQVFSVCPVQTTYKRFNNKYQFEIKHASRYDSWGPNGPTAATGGPN
jgi:hypothetical protein